MIEGRRNPRAEADAALCGHEVSDRRLRLLSRGLGGVSTAIVEEKNRRAAGSLIVGDRNVFVGIKGEKWRIAIIGGIRVFDIHCLDDISTWWCVRVLKARRGGA